MLLQEALGMSRQIGQRAATLKQLARVTIRQGLLSRAEAYLEEALELYKELYGDTAKHINIAAVKFQQGALAVQCDDFEQAWSHYSECLRIRRHVYAYARPCSTDKNLNPTHLEIACVLHELAHVAFAQGRFSQSKEMLQAEGAILERLQETMSTPMERLFQARLTNLTWLRKCSKELGDEDEAARLAAVKMNLKKHANQGSKEDQNKGHATALHQEAIRCRLIARKFVLSDSNEVNQNEPDREKLREALRILLRKINESPGCPMKQATMEFRKVVLECMDMSPKTRRSETLRACDVFR
jgi:tetratricopeptide (TPR) repeat protein